MGGARYELLGRDSCQPYRAAEAINTLRYYGFRRWRQYGVIMTFVALAMLVPACYHIYQGG